MIKIPLFIPLQNTPHLFGNGILYCMQYYGLQHSIFCYMNISMLVPHIESLLNHSVFKNDVWKVKCLHKICLISFVLYPVTCQEKKITMQPKSKRIKRSNYAFLLKLLFLCRKSPFKPEAKRIPYQAKYMTN